VRVEAEEQDRLRQEQERKRRELAEEEEKLRKEEEEKLRREEEERLRKEAEEKARARLAEIRAQFEVLSNQELSKEIESTLEKLQLLVQEQQKRFAQ